VIVRPARAWQEEMTEKEKNLENDGLRRQRVRSHNEQNITQNAIFGWQRAHRQKHMPRECSFRLAAISRSPHLSLVLSQFHQRWTWIVSIHPCTGLNWIRWIDYDPVLNSNYCSTVDAVSFKLWFNERLTIPVLPRLKVSIIIISGTLVYEFVLI